MLHETPEVEDGVAPPPDDRADFLQGKNDELREFFDRIGPDLERWTRKNLYYHRQVHAFFARRIPAGQRVLEIHCRTGTLLSGVSPAHGVGVEISSQLVETARQLHPELTFHCMDPVEVDSLGLQFDFVILNQVADLAVDLLALFKALRSCCHEDTRIIITSFGALWHPMLRLAGKLSLILEPPYRNWFTPATLERIIRLSGLETVVSGRFCLLPKYMPLLTRFCNRILAKTPGLSRLCLMHYQVVRCEPPTRDASDYRVSVVVPCKNEEGNVADVARRVPEMGIGTELIFVDDRSTDETAKEVSRAIERYPERTIRLVDGPGEGKGAAVRAGLESATGDVYTILDADMTVMPEALPEFYAGLVEGRGEFINGTRLVYPLEKDSMRTMNLAGNQMFAALISYLMEQPISDSLCGTKMLWARDYPKIVAARTDLRSVDVWGDFDWLFGAAYRNLKICELPVHYLERVTGRSKMGKRFRNALVMLRMCWHAYWLLKLETEPSRLTAPPELGGTRETPED